MRWRDDVRRVGGGVGGWWRWWVELTRERVGRWRVEGGVVCEVWCGCQGSKREGVCMWPMGSGG